MGESACVMTNYSEANQGPYGGESVSFGRFASESLSWEKWSTFSHKRYVEEAERYTQPGSVKEKKAFFEAHYKKIAAKKAAEETALREQKEALNAHPDAESETESCITYGQFTEIVEVVPIVDDQSNSAELKTLKVILEDTEKDDAMEKTKSTEELNKDVVSETADMEVSEGAEMEKPLLKDLKSTCDSSPTLGKKKTTSLYSRTLAQRKSPKFPVPLPAKYTASNHHKKENNATLITKKTLEESFNENRSIRKTVPKISISSAKRQVSVPNQKENKKSMDQTGSTPKLLPKIPVSPANSAAFVNIKEVANSTRKVSPAKRQVSVPNQKENKKSMDQTGSTPKLLPKIPVSPANSAAFVNIKEVANSTRKVRESPLVSIKKTTMTSLRTLIYSTPGKETDGSTSAKSSESSRVAPSSLKASKDYKTPSRTPCMDFTKRESKGTVAAPWSDSRRRTAQDSPTSGSNSRPKWHILSTVCSGSRSAHKSKEPSPTLTAPFNLRTEERAVRRKPKLEEKFNEKAMPKVQLQTRIKEKAETELRKLRRSLCFRARPLPEFYKEKGMSQNQIKDSKIPAASDIRSIKNSDFKNVIQKQKGVRNLLTSLPEKTYHENTSPNIKN